MLWRPSENTHRPCDPYAIVKNNLLSNHMQIEETRNILPLRYRHHEATKLKFPFIQKKQDAALTSSPFMKVQISKQSIV